MRLEVRNDIVIHPDTNEIEFLSGEVSDRVKIEPIAMELLEYMILRRGEVCTIDELVEELWDGNEPVGKPALRKIVYKLRMAFKNHTENEFIKTIPKKGYSFSDENIKTKPAVPFFRKRIIRLLVLFIILIILIKIIYPGIFSQLLHRLTH